MEQDKLDDKSSEQEEGEEKQTHIQPPSPPQSPRIHFDEDELMGTFLSQGIIYKPKIFQQEIQITVEELTTNYEIANIIVSYGHFQTLLKVINVDLENPCVLLPQAFMGSFGEVYKADTLTFPVAIKSIKLMEQKFENTFRQAIKEYLFLAIASAVKAGPRLVKFFGFDIIVFKDSLVFSMEFCEMTNYRINETLGLLKNKLRLLHALNIVHLDIKPENVAYSPAYNEYVFIDFGLSRMIKEVRGQKTLSSFSGSFNYCSSEMLGLYVKDSLGFVDLYSNDMQCLNKSVEYLHGILPDEGEDYLWKNNPNLNKFHECLILLQIKCAIYEFSFTISTHLQMLQKYRQFILSKKDELAQFILTLPQSLRLISFCKSELSINAIFAESEGLDDRVKGQNVPQRNGPPLMFFNRCSLMERARKCSHSRERIQIAMKIEESVLFDPENIKSFRASLYKLALIKLIKINGSTESFELKVKACKIYYTLHMELLPEAKADEELYRITVSHIFSTTLSSSKQGELFQIMKNVINTIVILEIVDEEVFVGAYETIFYMDLSLVQKLRLTFKFIASLQFVRQKYRKDYNYDKLTEIFFQRLSWFVQSQQEDKLSINIVKVLHRLRLLIQSKICKNSSKNSLCELPKPRRSRSDEYQLFLLNDHISYYMTSSTTLEEIDKFSHFNDQHLKFMMESMERANSRHHLTYSHLTLYFALHQTNQTSLNNLIYQSFHRQLKDYPQHKHFTIYLLNKLNKFKGAYSKKLLLERQEISINALRVDESQIDFEEIFAILDYIVKNLSRFHSYIGYLLSISTIQSSHTCVNHMGLLIQRNRDKIFQLSNYKHMDDQKFHNNQLRNEILILNNLSLFRKVIVSNQEQRIRTLQLLMENCQKAVEEHPCFECKVSGLLEINHIYSNYLCNKGLVEESFLHLFKMVTLSLKETAISFLPFLVHFVRRWVKHEFLYDKYDLRPFIYQYVTDFNKQHYCLIDAREYNIFLNIYLYIVEYYSEKELVDFLERIIQIMKCQKSMYLINNFYYTILCIIDTLKEQQQLNSFKHFHDQIIARMLPSQRIRHNPFKALYFMPLLEVKIKSGIESEMLKAITFCLDRLDTYTRDILISKYYEYFAYYMDVPVRKLLLLSYKHLKQETRPMPLKHLLKCKLGRVKKVSQGNEKYRVFRMLVERYHRNIGNVN